MPRKKATTNGSALATVEPAAPPALRITRSEANVRQKARALELYHEARTKREEQSRAFEAECGRADRLDHTILADLQRIQARLAAIAARQHRGSSYGEPKVSKHVELLGQLLGSVAGFLATQRALELFTPVQQADYVGYAGSGVGPKGLDEALLAGYEIVDDPRGAKNVTPTVDDDGEVCLHTDVEAFEDEPTRGACTECAEEFEFPAEQPRGEGAEVEEAAHEPVTPQ
ncbi:MAG: hypothetical protein WAN59_03520 [Candidatus Baltobacteraceae bacterium]